MATRQKLYAKYGQTAEAAQLFETALGTIALTAHGFNNGWHISQDKEKAEVIYQSIEDSTLGNILTKLRKEMKIPDSLLNQFTSAKKTRDRLFHGFFERHNFKIETPEGRDEMISDLDKIHEEILRAHGVASGIAQVMVDEFVKWQKSNNKEETPLPGKR